MASHPDTYTAYAFQEAGGKLQKVTVAWKDPEPGHIVVKVLACGVCGRWAEYPLFPLRTLTVVCTVMNSSKLALSVPSLVFLDTKLLAISLLSLRPKSITRSAKESGAGGTVDIVVIVRIVEVERWICVRPRSLTVCTPNLNARDMQLQAGIDFSNWCSVSGVTTDGGYAEYATLRRECLALVPEDMDPAEAAPLFCAGMTVFSMYTVTRSQALFRLLISLSRCASPYGCTSG